jgi:MFS family permease
MEWSRSHTTRGFVASWPQLGVPGGLFLANLAVLAVSRLSRDQFLAWGWRLPFFVSLLLVGVGLWIRLGILETPVFRRLAESHQIERAPLLRVLQAHPREIVLCAALRMAEQAPFYIFTAFIFSYAKLAGLAVPRDLVLAAVLAASVVGFVPIPLAGYLSDRIGRKRAYMLGAAAMGAFGFVYFALLGSGSLVLVFGAIVVSLVPTSLMQGPQAALIAESFTGQLRYSGASLGFQLASLIAGGPAPLIATWLFDRTRSGYSVAGYVLACSAISLIAASRLKGHAGRHID